MTTTVTKTIGLSGRDFSSVQAWIDSLPSDLTAVDEAHVGLVYNDGELVSGSQINFSGHTTDATRNILLAAAPGQSWRDNANVQTNRLAYDPANGAALKTTVNYTNGIGGNLHFVTIRGLQITHTGQGGIYAIVFGWDTNITDVVMEDCIIVKPNVSPSKIGNWGGTLRNCTLVNLCTGSNAGGISTEYSYAAVIENCTIACPAGGGGTAINVSGASAVVENTAIFGFTSIGGVSKFKTFAYNAGDIAFGVTGQTNCLESLLMADQFVDLGATTYDLKLKSTSALRNAGETLTDVTDSANSLPRPQGPAYDIGAWEFQEATVVAPVFSSAVADNLSGGGVYVVFSNPLYDWTQSGATHAAPPASAFSVIGSLSGTHTFTGVVSDVVEGRIRLSGVSPFFKVGETITISYSAPTDGSGLYDSTGVKAVSSFSTQSVANNVQVSVPDAPIIGSASAGDGYVDVTFSPPNYDGSATIDHYTVLLSNNQTATGTTSPIRVTTPDGTAVTAQVSAHNSQGDSVYSAASNQVTPSATITVPGAPTSVTATAGAAGSGQATVSFTTPASDGGAAITSYTVTSNPGNITATGSGSPITVSGLTAGVVYTFSVQAINSQGTGATSAASNSITDTAAPTAPATPTIGTATAGPTGSGNVSVSFTPGSNGGDANVTYTVTSNPGGKTGTGTSSPITVSGLTDGNYTFTVTASNPEGTSGASAPSNSVTVVAGSNSGYPNNPVGSLIKSIGTGKDFATLAAFSGWLYNQNPVALGGMIIGEVYENQDCSGVGLSVQSYSPSCYALLRPAYGMGPQSGSPLRYGDSQITLTGGANSFSLGRSVQVHGFNIDIPDNANASSDPYFGGVKAYPPDGWGQTGVTAVDSGFYDCALRFSTSYNPITVGDHGMGLVFDSCLIVQKGSDHSFNISNGQAAFRNCGIIRLGSYASQVFTDCGNIRMVNGWGINLGGQLSQNTSNNWAEFRANVLDADITVGSNHDSSNVVGYVKGTNFVVDSSSETANFNPAAGGALVGHGDSTAVSTLDFFGSNRGLTPDIGPMQLTPATPLPSGSVQGQTPPDGQTITLSGSYSGTVSGFVVSLVPDSNTPNGATPVGPVNVTYANGTFSVAIDSIPSGNYQAPVLKLSNDGGAATIYGLSAFSIIGFAGSVYDTGLGETTPGTGSGAPLAPVVSLTTADNQVLDGYKTAQLAGTVNYQGDASGTLHAYLDPYPVGASLDLGAVTVVNGNWNISTTVAAGGWKLRLVATGNGQTTTVSTGTLTELSLTGNGIIPMPT